MGIVYNLECPVCKKKVYIGADVSQVKCPECKKGTIVNVKSKLKSSSISRGKKFVFTENQEAKTSTCTKCNIQFTTPPALFRGKVFCPSCGTEVKLEGVTQI